MRLYLPGGHVALFDARDAAIALGPYAWSAQKKKKDRTWYVLGSVYDALIKRQRSVLLHRLILRAKRGTQIDHRNSNGLDNRRRNLRRATARTNQQNCRPHLDALSRFKGVDRITRPSGNRVWRARICVNGTRLLLGYFDNERKAARSYDVAARRHFGSFARPNFGSR